MKRQRIMFGQTDDGASDANLNLVGLQHGGNTPQGPQKWATPLSPSITEEVSSVSNNASTVNDELYAWLLQNKVDDERIGNYLCSREITLHELSTFEDEDLRALTQDIDKENKTTIPIIDKKRFMQACRKLRPQRPQSQSVSNYPGSILSPPSQLGMK